MPPRIEIRKNITIFKTLDNTGKFTQKITLDFIPDEVKVKAITYISPIAEANLSVIYSDLTNENITSFFDNYYSTDVYIKELNKPIDGTFTFTCLLADGGIDDTRGGDLYMLLEFKKFEKRK